MTKPSEAQKAFASHLNRPKVNRKVLEAERERQQVEARDRFHAEQRALVRAKYGLDAA